MLTALGRNDNLLTGNFVENKKKLEGKVISEIEEEN